MADGSKKIVFWNYGAERLTGYLGLEMLGRPYREDLVVYTGEDKGSLSSGGCLLVEQILLSRDGC